MVTNETWSKKENVSHQQPCAHVIGLLHSVISFAVLAETDEDGVDAKLERKRIMYRFLVANFERLCYKMRMYSSENVHVLF